MTKEEAMAGIQADFARRCNIVLGIPDKLVVELSLLSNHVSVDAGSWNVWCELRGELDAVLSALREEGYTVLDPDPTGKTDYAEYARKDGRSPIYVSYATQICKRIQVGTRTRTIEEPVYETVCAPEADGSIAPYLDEAVFQ